MIISLSDPQRKHLVSLLGTSPFDVDLQIRLDPHGEFHTIKRLLTPEEVKAIVEDLSEVLCDGYCDEPRSFIEETLESGFVGYDAASDEDLISEVIDDRGREDLPPAIAAIKAVQDAYQDRDEAAYERQQERRLEGG